MKAPLQGKRFVVIGGTTGLGFSAARAFVKQGARVVIVGRNESNVAKAKKRLGRNALGLAADAADPETGRQGIAMLVEKWGALDGLYHVAGGSGRRMGDGPLQELTDDGWTATLDMKLTSWMISNREAGRQFLEQRRTGAI